MFFAHHHIAPQKTTAHSTGTSPARFPRTARGGAVVVALLLAACAHSPKAAVATPGVDEVQAVSISSASGCRETPVARAALQNITQELRAQGMALKAHCQVASGGWVVQVQVTDGAKASTVVRGPLADGHDVDMGTPAGVQLAGAPTAAGGFSPDVQHNRQWLHAVMARHQFDNLPDAWWHFAQRGTAPAQASETDLAAR
ncbi:MAG: M15 family metallopeptidase [Acidovorax sp.]|uniref:M15 family metallopeptidase n=1 Tax=Acidovorax sp. TaxID=1872122 RepID=UPI00391AA7DD